MNKHIKIVVGIILSVAILVGFFSFTNKASAESCNSRTITGKVTTNGTATNARFIYGTDYYDVSEGYGAKTPVQTFYSDGNISTFISGLYPNTKYFYSLEVTNYIGSDFSPTNDFTTPPCDNPVISPVIPPTQSPTASITATPATCVAPCNIKVNITSNNVENILKVYRNGSFIWNRYGNQSDSETDWSKGAGTYEYCVRSVNNNWIESGNLGCDTVTVTNAVIPPPNPIPPLASNPSATITSTSLCIAPCNILVSWTSLNVSTDSNIVKIYKNGQFLWNQNANVSGSEKDWGMPTGTYEYCIRAVKSDWSETNNLNCFTSKVTTPLVLNMSGTLTPANSSCIISAGFSSCPITFSWNTINPVALSSVTSNGATLANGNSNNSSFSIPRGSKIFFLYNNAIKLDEKTVSAECASNLIWDNNSSTCKTQAINPPVNPPTPACQDTSAINFGGTLPCRYVPQTCQDRSAMNFGGTLPCRYAPQMCQDTASINYGGALPCRYAPQTCQDTASINYGGTLPCRYAPQTCQDTSAINRDGALPCRYAPVVQNPTVTLTADLITVSINGNTRLRWNSTNAVSCTANGGTNGWSGSKDLSGSFSTGALRARTVFNITCVNSAGTQAHSTATVNVRSRFFIITL